MAELCLQRSPARWWEISYRRRVSSSVPMAALKPPGQCVYSSEVLQGHRCCVRNFSMVSAVALGGNNLITLFFRSICG